MSNENKNTIIPIFRGIEARQDKFQKIQERAATAYQRIVELLKIKRQLLDKELNQKPEQQDVERLYQLQWETDDLEDLTLKLDDIRLGSLNQEESLRKAWLHLVERIKKIV